MTGPRPRVSFGVPARNAEDCIRRCLDSILAQDFADWEVVVCDNASTDRTREIVEEYAARDDRIRVFLNEEDIGLVGNFNRVVHLARGEYFRWVGVDDWLEPGYASECVAALDADPGAIVATTYFRLHDDRGCSQYEQFQGEFLESDRAERRFARMLWSFHAGAALYEPIYSLMRRDVLMGTGLVRMLWNQDRILAAELSLIGRFQHVPKLLFHRSRPRKPSGDRRRLRARLDPRGKYELQLSAWRLLRELNSIICAAPLQPGQRARCHWVALRFYSKDVWKRSLRSLHRFRRERFGLTRQRLRALVGRRS